MIKGRMPFISSSCDRLAGKLVPYLVPVSSASKRAKLSAVEVKENQTKELI